MDYWNLYKDVWNFHKKYSKVQTDDAYWEAVVDESGQIAKSMIITNLRLRYYWRSLMNWNGFIRR